MTHHIRYTMHIKFSDDELEVTITGEEIEFNQLGSMPIRPRHIAAANAIVEVMKDIIHRNSYRGGSKDVIHNGQD